MENVAVVGAGTMGAGIAHVCALAGMNVRLIDVDEGALERAMQTIRANLARQAKKKVIADGDVRSAFERIRPHALAEGRLADASVVVEAVSERRDVKRGLMQMIDREADAGALVASNTSSISITWLGSCTSRPGDVVGMHFFNPVPVMRLVEVVRGLETSEATVERTMRLARTLGKMPVAVNDAPGFVSNRVLMPMINEAIYCVMEGVAEPTAVDAVMKLGMAHPLGPLALADLIGLDVCLDILEVLHREQGDDKYRPCPLLRRMVDAGQIGRKSGRGFYSYEDS